MSGFFTKVEVTDPRLLGQSLWESLPPTERASLTEREYSSQEWAPLDQRRFRLEPENFRTAASVANVGALRASRITGNGATEMTLRSPGIDGFGLLMIERGSNRLILPGTDEPLTGNTTTGFIYGIQPGIRLTASVPDRLFLRLPASLIRGKLEALLDGQSAESIEFQPMFDQTRSAGATIRRMLDYLFAELEQPDTLLTNEIAIRSFEENRALCLLLGLPHNYTERLQRQKTAAAPGNIRRAEEFMRANASLPLTITEIAEAAGCSVRALQIAFQRFRGTSRCACCNRPGWNRREPRCCVPAKRNHWPGSPLSTDSAVRPGLLSPSGADTGHIHRKCGARGATPSPGSTRLAG
jgi:AraC-like DNA-binding protein